MNFPSHKRPHGAPNLILTLATALFLTPPSHAVDKSWIGGSGMWNSPAHWTPAGVPPLYSNIYIGNMPGVQNSTVTMDHDVVTVICDYFELTDGMTLDMNGSELISTNDAEITGAGTHLICRLALPGLNSFDFWADTHIGPGAHLELMDDVPIDIGYFGWNEGLISGHGYIRLGAEFHNDGIIKPGASGPLQLDFAQFADGGADLDGNSGNGQLQLDIPFSQMHVEGKYLVDSFSGTISMVPGALLTMNILENWTADASADINILGANNPNAASQIDGDLLTFGGALNIGANQAHLRMLADCNLQLNPNISIAANGWLEFDGQTTVSGGQYTVGQAAQLDFDGNTTVQGGAFATSNNNPANGTVDFNGNTTYNGTMTVNGIARQCGHATVTGITNINAGTGTFDMDGTSGVVIWDVNYNCTINAGQIDSSFLVLNHFNGLINIPGGLPPRLTINLANPYSTWFMAGTMNLNGLTGLYETRVAGSPMIVTGSLNLTAGKVNITADTTFSSSGDPATVSLASPGGVLRFTATTFVGGQTSFSGSGTLQNSPTGAMTLDDGVLLGGAGLVNQGHLFIRRDDLPNQAGLISVDRFTNEAGATWQVRIGGYTLGQDYDHIVVTNGTATLNGNLQISQFNAGGVPFNPQIGDEFVILTAVGGVSGNLVVEPSACMDGNSYNWSVIIGPNDVRVRLDSISGMPGDMNCDCRVNALDIQRFVNAVLDPASYAAANPDCGIGHADINNDGVVNVNDVNPFSQLLLSAP